MYSQIFHVYSYWHVQITADVESRLHSVGIQITMLTSNDLSNLSVSVKVTNGLVLDLHHIMSKSVHTTRLRIEWYHCVGQCGL